MRYFIASILDNTILHEIFFCRTSEKAYRHFSKFQLPIFQRTIICTTCITWHYTRNSSYSLAICLKKETFIQNNEENKNQPDY
jgi:hypothetical protein